MIIALISMRKINHDGFWYCIMPSCKSTILTCGWWSTAECVHTFWYLKKLWKTLICLQSDMFTRLAKWTDFDEVYVELKNTEFCPSCNNFTLLVIVSAKLISIAQLNYKIESDMSWCKWVSEQLEEFEYEFKPELPTNLLTWHYGQNFEDKWWLIM